jgi:aryl-phospho-beta-D-glucosidase BglC (GH1 family)
MTPADWAFLRDAGKVTSVRLPIGWFTHGPHFCAGTPFEAYGSIYVNAWTAVKGYIHAAAEHGITVLLDLHALPGGANKDEHSGTGMIFPCFCEGTWADVG